MLFHLISRNPNKDITLHVSTNNPAMVVLLRSLLSTLSDPSPTKLLYNRFGFKAEEFIVGFYEDYLDPQSRMSKNAFRLRLRR
jgi:ribosomal protein S18 acetylase RimI-like enzyme